MTARVAFLTVGIAGGFNGKLAGGKRGDQIVGVVFILGKNRDFGIDDIVEREFKGSGEGFATGLSRL
ncbi:hypothetical protein N7486_006038 [Penicillium sp. IBT 16267x]|nr:hypothetical protein N7486_006038 [Penicillium sp. IBT 16267x]